MAEFKKFYTAFHTLKNYYESLTPEERVIAEMDNFNFTSYHDRFFNKDGTFIVGFSDESAADHVLNIIEECKNDIKEHQKRLARKEKALSTADLLCRYIALDSLKRYYVTLLWLPKEEESGDMFVTRTLALIERVLEEKKEEDDEYGEMLERLDAILKRVER